MERVPLVSADPKHPAGAPVGLASVHGLRALAALLVLCAHIIEHNYPRDPLPDQIITLGRFGVEIFFVISGFIIQYANGPGAFSPRRFLFSRIFRIVPLYWATSTLLLLITFAAPDILNTTDWDPAGYVRSLFFLPTHDLTNPGDWRPFYKLGWTLNYEVFFYALMLALWRIRSSGHRAMVLCAIMLALVALSQALDGRSWVSFYANVNLIPFALGVAMAEWRRRRPERTLPALWLVGFAVFVPLTFSFPYQALRSLGPHLAMSLAAASIIGLGLSAERWRVWRLAAVRTLGDASYSIYLTHMFVVAGVGVAAAALRLPFIVGALAAVAATVAVAVVSFRVFETPMNRIGRALGSVGPSPARAAVAS